PVQDGHVQLDVPTVAADGRVVPVMIESDLPMAAERYVKAVHLLVDNNPDIHLAEFRLTPQIGQAFVSTRIKMRMTSPVRAIVETSDGALWGAAADVRVTVNGCGRDDNRGRRCQGPRPDGHSPGRRDPRPRAGRAP